MTTQLVPIGNTATQFADGEFTVPAGGRVSLAIKGNADGGIPAGVNFEIARKTSGGHYMLQLVLDSNNILEKGMVYGGSEDVVYASRRPVATNVSAGMDRS